MHNNSDEMMDKEFNESTISCEYEGFVSVEQTNFSSRNVATNTMHVPTRRRPAQCIRSKAWSHTAKQFLSQED